MFHTATIQYLYIREIGECDVSSSGDAGTGGSKSEGGRQKRYRCRLNTPDDRTNQSGVPLRKLRRFIVQLPFHQVAPDSQICTGL